MATTTDPAVLNPAAYGSIPIIPPTSTNTSQSTSGWDTSLPNYAALAAKSSGNIGNQLAGTLNPQDLANAQTWAAQRGISTGTGFESPNNMAAYQQFLGLSSQGLQQQGQTNLNAALAAAPRTTSTSGSQTTDNNVLAAITAAAPNPYAAAMANLASQQSGLGAGLGSARPGAAPTGGGGAGVGGPVVPPGGVAAMGGGYPAPGVNTGSITLGATAAPAQPATGTNAQYGGAAQTTGFSGAVTDSQGNQWVDMGDGTYMNLATGDVQQGAPGGSSVSGAINLGGNQTFDMQDPFAGTAAQSPAYGSMPDYSQVGADPMAGLLGGDLSGGQAATDPFAGDVSDPTSAWWNGYQDVSQGSMYMGDTSGYGGG
jgi:hypothetical protein